MQVERPTPDRLDETLALLRTADAQGEIGSIGVRRAWRRRGLGLALVRDSFRRFRESGETVVALGVDAENATGAVRLYEHAGMRVLWRADVWEKELRTGA